MVERPLPGAFAAIAQQHFALPPRTAPTPPPRERDQKPAAWHSKATEKPAFRTALVSLALDDERQVMALGTTLRGLVSKLVRDLPYTNHTTRGGAQ